jgi:hypothetical protein
MRKFKRGFTIGLPFALLPYSHGYGSAPLPRGPRMVCGSHAISFKNNKHVSETVILSEQLLPPQNITVNIAYITGWCGIFICATSFVHLSLRTYHFKSSNRNCGTNVLGMQCRIKHTCFGYLMCSHALQRAT